MELRRELLLTIGALVLLNLCLAFGAIALLLRMGPSYERIVQDNVYSIFAAEEVLIELVGAGNEPLTPDAEARIQRFTERAKLNITEDEEQPLIAALERSLLRAAAGDLQARRESVATVRQLIRVNREAMRRVSNEARRLGEAGAWASVLVGFVSFLLSLVVVARLQQRFVRPLVDLYQVLESARHGDKLRRCRLSDAPREVVQVTQAVNKLLDERLSRV